MRSVEVAEQQHGFWFDRVDTGVEEGDDVLLEGGSHEIRRLCLGGCCYVNCWSTSNFGKRVGRCLKHLAALRDKGEQFEAVAEEALADLVAEFDEADSFWGFLARHAVLKLEDMKNLIGELGALKNDVMRRVEVADPQQKKQLEKVGFWFDRVDAAIDEGDLLLKSSIQEVRRLGFGGYRSVNCWSTLNFGRRVNKCLKHLAALKDEGELFAAVAEEAPADMVAELPYAATIGAEGEGKFNEVWSCLQEQNVGIIGLYGIGGVGKIILLTQI